MFILILDFLYRMYDVDNRSVTRPLIYYKLQIITIILILSKLSISEEQKYRSSESFLKVFLIFIFFFFQLLHSLYF